MLRILAGRPTRAHGWGVHKLCSLADPLVPGLLCTVRSQAKASFSLPGIKVWVPHTRRLINHKHEIGFCNRTGVENPLAVSPSRLVYFFFFSRGASVRGLGCPSVLMFVSLLVKATPLHPRLAVILLELFQESVSRPCAQGCKRVKPPYRNSPGKVPWTVSRRPSYWISLSRDDSVGEVPAPTWFVTPEGTHAICVKLPNWSTEG